MLTKQIVSYGIWQCALRYTCAYASNEPSKTIMVDNLDNYLQTYSNVTSPLTCDISSIMLSVFPASYQFWHGKSHYVATAVQMKFLSYLRTSMTWRKYWQSAQQSSMPYLFPLLHIWHSELYSASHLAFLKSFLQTLCFVTWFIFTSLASAVPLFCSSLSSSSASMVICFITFLYWLLW